MPFTEDDDLKVAMELQRAIDEMHCSSCTTTTAHPLSSFASADLQSSQQPIYCPFGLPVLALFDTCQPFVPGAVSMLLAPEEHSVVPTHNNPQHQWCILFPSAFTPTPLLAQPLANQKNKMMAVSVGSAVGGSDEKEVPLLQQQQLQKPIPVICKSIVVQRRRHDSSLAVMHVGSPVRNFKGKSALADFSNAGLWNTALPKVFACAIKGKYSSNSSTFVSQIEFKVGDWVVHDGDQGFGIGEVIDCTLQPSKRFGATTERQRAYRVATMKELQLFEGQRVFERKILKFLSSLSTLARSGVDMEAKYHDAYWSSIGSMDFLTVEMQADANTLTVHFEADSTIRIKDLSAMLNSYFKCRIWVRQIVDGNEQKQKKPKTPKTQTKSNNKNTDADDFATFTVSSSS